MSFDLFEARLRKKQGLPIDPLQPIAGSIYDNRIKDIKKQEEAEKKDAVEERIKTTKNKKKTIPDNQPEIINSIIKDKPNINTARKYLKKYIELYDDEYSD